MISMRKNAVFTLRKIDLRFGDFGITIRSGSPWIFIKNIHMTKRISYKRAQ